MIALALCAALLWAGQDARRTANVSVFDVGPERTVHDGLELDLNGDGTNDLVLALSRSGGGRELALFLARSGPGMPHFAAPANATIELTADVVAFAGGELDPSNPGRELALFSARGAFLCRPLAPSERRFAKLIECDFLWQLGDPEECFVYNAGLLDIDRDGALDLVLPEPGGFAIARAHPGESTQPLGFPSVAKLRVPVEVLPSEGSSSGGGGQKRGSLDISFGAEEPRSRTLLSVSERVPAPQFFDFDGDGRLDLQVLGVRTLWVWLQSAPGHFTAEPQYAFPFPVPADGERRLDASYAAHVIDIDQDGRSDLGIFAGDKRSEDVRTQLLLFVQGKGRGDAKQTPDAPLFGPKALPQQLLVLGGFGLGAYFDDLDGDRRPDLFVRAVRPDLIDQLRSTTSESIDAELLVYKNENGEISRKPALTWRVPIPINDFDLTVSFVGDLDGDRLSDLALRSEPERIRLLGMRRAKEGWQLDPKPLYESAIQRTAKIMLLYRTDRPVRDVAVIEDTQVMLIRFP